MNTDQGRRKQSPDGQAQLDVDGEAVNNSCAKHTAKNLDLAIFLAVRRPSQCTSASNWNSKAWKFSRSKSYAYALSTYPAGFYYSNSRPHKCQTHNYVLISAENGPAMARPAGPVPAPMQINLARAGIVSTTFIVPSEMKCKEGFQIYLPLLLSPFFNFVIIHGCSLVTVWLC